MCILANPIHGVKPFLKETKFNCFDIWQKIDTDYERPFLAIQNVRNLESADLNHETENGQSIF